MKFQGSKNHTKTDQKSIKNEAKMGIALGIDFSWIFVDFWNASCNHIGIKNHLEIDPKKHQNDDAKKKSILSHVGGVLGAAWRRFGQQTSTWDRQKQDAPGAFG